jgi:hypothetical protein
VLGRREGSLSLRLAGVFAEAKPRQKRLIVWEKRFLKNNQLSQSTMSAAPDAKGGERNG